MTEDDARQQAMAAFDQLRLTAAQTSEAVDAVQRSRETLVQSAETALDQIEETRRITKQLSENSAEIAKNSGGILRETARLVDDLKTAQSLVNSFEVRIDTSTRNALRGEIELVIDVLKRHTDRLEQTTQEMENKFVALGEDLQSNTSSNWTTPSQLLIAVAFIAFIVGVLVGAAGMAAIAVVVLTAIAAGVFWYVTTQRQTQ